MADFKEKMDIRDLEDNCYDKKTMEVVVKYDDEVLSEMKAEFFEISRQLDEKQNLIEEIRDILMQDVDEENVIKELLCSVIEATDIKEEGIKSLKRRQKELISVITKGWSEQKMMCYLLEDYKQGKMAIYLEDGSLYLVRDLEPAEKQVKIKKAS